MIRHDILMFTRGWKASNAVSTGNEDSNDTFRTLEDRF